MSIVWQNELLCLVGNMTISCCLYRGYHARYKEIMIWYRRFRQIPLLIARIIIRKHSRQKIQVQIHIFSSFKFYSNRVSINNNPTKINWLFFRHNMGNVYSGQISASAVNLFLAEGKYRTLSIYASIFSLDRLSACEGNDATSMPSSKGDQPALVVLELGFWLPSPCFKVIGFMKVLVVVAAIGVLTSWWMKRHLAPYTHDPVTYALQICEYQKQKEKKSSHYGLDYIKYQNSEISSLLHLRFVLDIGEASWT